MKQSAISSFFKRSATASDELLRPAKKLRGELDSPRSSQPSPSSKPEKIVPKKIEAIKEDDEELVATPPIPDSPSPSPPSSPKVNFSVDSGDETEEDEDAHQHVKKLAKRSQSMPESALKAAARGRSSSDEENEPPSLPSLPLFENSPKFNKPKVDKSKSRLVKQHPLGSCDITEEHTGAIVNAANSRLAHGGGVAGAISRKGGPQIQSESDKWVRQNGTVSAGKVAVTGAGRLPCSTVIHAVGPIWTGGKRGEDKELYGAVWHSLLKAHQLNLHGISIPAISSGIFGFPKERCAYIMTECAVKFCAKYSETSLQEIRFTNFDNETVHIFETEFQNRFEENEDEADNDENNENDENDENDNQNSNSNFSNHKNNNITTPNNTTTTNTLQKKNRSNADSGDETEEDEDLVQPTGHESSDSEDEKINATTKSTPKSNSTKKITISDDSDDDDVGWAKWSK